MTMLWKSKKEANAQKRMLFVLFSLLVVVVAAYLSVFAQNT